jgi:hypothetical protein
MLRGDGGGASGGTVAPEVAVPAGRGHRFTW